MSRRSGDKEGYNSSHHRQTERRDTSSDSESDSNSSASSRRGSSAERTDEEDGGRSTPEEAGRDGNHRNSNTHSRSEMHKSDRYRGHESRHLSSSSTDKKRHKRDYHKSDHDRSKRSGRYRSNSSSSDNSDSHRNRKKRKTRSRSRESKSAEREPDRRNANPDRAVGTQKIGDRRLFPNLSDDRGISLAPGAKSEEDTFSWREGGPLPPPVFIGSQPTGHAPPPPNISGRVPPQAALKKGSNITPDRVTSAASLPSAQTEKQRSFVPPPFLRMPPPPNSNPTAATSTIYPPPLGGREIPPPLHGVPPAPPPALGHRPPPPPIRPPTSHLPFEPSVNQQSSRDISNNIKANVHEARKAPKKLPEPKPEVKRPPPKVLSGPVKNIAIKLGASAKAKHLGLNQKLPAKVASVFGADDSDSEEEEMPHEAKMRMRNVGRDTVTSSGPNSFGKTRQGFTDTKRLYEKNMHKPLFGEDD